MSRPDPAAVAMAGAIGAELERRVETAINYLKAWRAATSPDDRLDQAMPDHRPPATARRRSGSGT